MRFRPAAPWLYAVVTALLVSGCLRGHAKAVTDAPPLETPPAPPRYIATETVDANPPAIGPLVEEPPRQPIQPPARPQPRDAVTRPPDPPKVETPATEPPPAAAEAPKPPATLQTTRPGSEAEVERGIRERIQRANTELKRVHVGRLNQDARLQYDMAKRFIQQAEEALRPPPRFDFAGNLADKASALALQLAGR